MAFQLDEAQLRQLFTSPKGPVYQVLFRTGNQVLNQAKIKAPVDQGQLRASILLEMDQENGAPVARVGTNVRYALFVHEGTGIYGPRKTSIVPKTKRFLRWPVKNQSGRGRRRYKAGKTQAYVYARSVKGVPARPFLTDALEAVVGKNNVTKP